MKRCCMTICICRLTTIDCKKMKRNACTKLVADTVMYLISGTVHFKVTIEWYGFVQFLAFGVVGKNGKIFQQILALCRCHISTNLDGILYLENNWLPSSQKKIKLTTMLISAFNRPKRKESKSLFVIVYWTECSQTITCQCLLKTVLAFLNNLWGLGTE